MFNKYLKKALPHIVALVVFAAISAMFFSPQYSDKAMRQGDMVQVNGMGQDIVEHQQQYHEHPQWAGRMFGGMPAYLINMNYDGRWIKNVADQSYFLGQPAAWLFIAMASFYLMLLMFGVSPWLSIVGGVAYGLSTYFPIIIQAGHVTKMMALAWIPAVIGSVYYAYRKNWLLGAALAGIFLSIEISTSHPQITYYFGFVILALFANEFIRAYKEQLLKRFTVATVALIAAAALAVGSNAVQLYYVADYSKETIRGKSELAVAQNSGKATTGLDKDYATAWSYGKAESFNMFIPNFAGGSHSFAPDGKVAQTFEKYGVDPQAANYVGSYFGAQPFTSGPVYIGAVMVFLCVFGMFYLRGREKWWVAGVSLLALMLAWGHNLNWLTDLFLDYFPLYNKFRTVSMILVVLEWSIPFLAILALSKLFTEKSSENFDTKHFDRSLLYSLSITGGFALIAALILPSLMSFTNPGDTDSVMRLFYNMTGGGFDPSKVADHAQILQQIVANMELERADLLRSDSFRSLILVLLTAAALWLYAKGKIKGMIAIAAVGVISTADLYLVDRRFVKTEDFQPKKTALEIQATAADKQIMEDKSDYRVANFTAGTFQDATTSRFHRSVGGYHAAKLRRYQDLIDMHLSKENMAVYDMLNTKYFIMPDGVHQNENAAGSAWLVGAIRWVDNPDQEIAALGENFDPHAAAIVDKRFQNIAPKTINAPDSTAHIELAEYRVNHLTYKYSSPQPSVALFSEIYYPKGWTAYIDGQQAEYFRADYVLRAMALPAGEHTVEWKFAAPHFDALVATTKASSVLLILVALAGAALTLRKKNRDKPEKTQ